MLLLSGLLTALALSGATPRYLVTHLAGSPGGGGQQDGAGVAARFRFPNHLAIDRTGTLYVADQGNYVIRKITPDAVVTTFAGSPGQTGQADGVGAAARFAMPGSLATDSLGNLYVADLANFTIRKITPAGLVTTFAGSPGQRGGTDGVGTAARFGHIVALTIDRSDILYVLDEDENPRRRSVRRITPAGSVTTLLIHDGDPARSINFREFSTIAADPVGNLHIVDISGQLTAERFFVVTPNGTAVPVGSTNVNGSIGSSVIDAAGNFYLTYPFARSGIVKIAPGPTTSVGGYAVTTSGVMTVVGGGIPSVHGVAVDQAGNLYTSLPNSHVIRKIAPDGTVSDFAGLEAQPGTTDGTGTAARFSSPAGVALDPGGNLYVADWNNGAVRKVDPTGTVTTPIALNSGAAAAAGVGFITGVAVDGAGNLYAADHGKRVVRRFSPDGSVATLAGTPGVFGRADGVGAAAQFDSLRGAALDRHGNFYTAGLSAIRKITPAGEVTTLAGSPVETGTADGAGAGARFFQPFGLAVDADNNVYVADTYNHTIRKVTPAGVVSTLAGSPGQEGSADGLGSAARFSYPAGLKSDRDGTLYVADAGNNTIRLVTPAGAVTTIMGRSGVSGSDDGLDLAARFESPTDLALDALGHLYIADTGNNAVRKAAFLGFALEITSQPQSQSVSAGGSVVFSVTVGASTTPPTYQWYRNGAAVSGATGSSLTLSQVTAASAGSYTVVVTNPLGSVTSLPATLTVTAGPGPADPAVPGGGSGGGGGAPSVWFFLALAGVGVMRRMLRRRS